MENVLKKEQKALRAAGLLFLLAIVFYASGSAVTSGLLSGADYLRLLPARQTTLAAGVLLMLCNSVAVAGIGVLLLPVLQRWSPTVAYVYWSARLAEALLLAVGALFLLAQVSIGKQWEAVNATTLQSLSIIFNQINYLCYQTAMAVLGLGSVLFCWALLRFRLLPRWLALWGLVGYAVFLVGAVGELLGWQVGLLLSLPGGLFEVVLGFWLVLKISPLRH